MDPFLAKMMEATLMERLSIAQADHQLAVARLRDTSLHGLKVIEGVVAKELLVSDDAAEFGRTNAAIRVPTTLEHYPAPVNK